ncbi:inner membrane protein YhjD [Pseudonocardia spinosispora]|uniref:inner membrane protein YhjD n=1 Tax=Pseudonocardia spinosispora TaxID=103441 RepID=UPI0003F9236B|nr:inner membrane protein YhjD [Pseudonocardia spinosispora]
MTSAVADKPEKPSKIAELRKQHEWLDHLLRAGESYTVNHGDHYAAAITYFSVLALFPLLMVAFAAVAFFLRANQDLVTQLKMQITQNAPGMGDMLGSVIDQAIRSAGTVGVIGLLVALYSGLGWMTNLREALSEQWGQRDEPPTLLRRLVADLLALIGLGIALVVSAAVSAVGGLAKQIVGWLGLESVTWLTPLISLAGWVAGLLASALVFLWVIARLPREPVTWRSAAKAALIGAVGFVVIQRIMVFYIVSVTSSPAGAAFGPIIGLLVFIFTVSRFLLFLTAWAATAKENMIEEPPPAPSPAVIRTEVTVGGGVGAGVTAGLVGAGALAGLLGGLFARRR